MKTIITAQCLDQTLTLTNSPKLASGGENVFQVEVTFDSYWDGYGKEAVFYKDKTRIFHVVMTEDVCVLPWELTAEPGKVHFSVRGVKGSVTRSSEEIILSFVQGAPLETSYKEPLPDVYKQLMSAYGETGQAVNVERARIDNLIANGGTSDDAELIDVRVGYDGMSYGLAGEAVRKQFSYICDGLVNMDYTAGNISANGSITDGATESNNYYSELIPRSMFNTITVTATGNRQINYCLYDHGEFVSRGTWQWHSAGTTVETSYTLDNAYDVRLMFATQTEYDPAGLTVAEVLTGVKIQIDWQMLPLKELTQLVGGKASSEALDFLQRVAACGFEGRLMHFSVDDVCGALYDLTTGEYSSIYDCPFFAGLKSVHDETGACFTLNCFNTSTSYADYSISAVPTTYQAEFQEAKSWLRFAFHAENEDSRYNRVVEDVRASYDTFVKAVSSFTGDYECIDRITRLTWFSGCLDVVKQLKNAEYGIIGLLAADDERVSYYLTEEQNQVLTNKGKFFDGENELIFFRTMPRMDSNDAATIQTHVESNLCYQKVTEIFLHEGSLTGSAAYGYFDKLSAVAKWANERGYMHIFPCDVYDPGKTASATWPRTVASYDGNGTVTLKI